MKLVEMTWPEVAALTKDEAAPVVALLPIASIEQHGPHLAVSTDTALATAIAEQVESALPDDVVLCPTLTYGSSHHHLGFPGVMSISHETYVRVLVDLAESLLKSGFRRIVLFNGHGGNSVPGKQALNILSDRYDDKLHANIVLATYWELGGSAFAGDPPLETNALTHACEYETSMMLHVHPERVHMERAEESVSAPSNSYINWQLMVPNRGIAMSKGFHLLLSNGSNGKPQLATAAKGQHLIEQAVTATTAFVQEFRSWPFVQHMRS